MRMITLSWQGSPIPAGWASKLSALGVEVVQPGQADAVCLTVCCTSKASEEPSLAVPSTGAAPGAWLWLSPSNPSTERQANAAVAGALDVIALDEPKALERLAQRAREANVPELALPPSPGFVAYSTAARRVLRDLLRAAQTSMPVLLTGETGTGKEVSARLVHDWSKRRSKLFVPINCAAIPDDLIESELFGYVRGAFSGAIRDYDGQLMAAEGGSVFLDEIDDTPPTLQIKLLRVLEDRVVSRLGQNEWHRVDFRIIAATNRDLEELIAKGEFGQDLFERLAIVHVKLPPLRERTDDLPVLAAHFIERYYGEEPAAPGAPRVNRISAGALSALADYRWPGNVRELRNVVYEALVRKPSGEELLISDLPRRVLARAPGPASQLPLVDPKRLAQRFDSSQMNLRRELSELEKAALTEALRRSGGNLARAARLLGEVGRGASRDPAGTVRAMLNRLGLAGGTPPEPETR